MCLHKICKKFRCHEGMLDYWIHTLHGNNSIHISASAFKEVTTMLVWQCLTWYWTDDDTNIMSCVPNMWQYCWKEISAVANIFYLVHCLLRHEITLHVLCRDKYSTSMQQYCHPGNNSYKQEPYDLGACAHHRRRGPNQMLNNVLLVLRTELTLFFSFF